MFRALRAVVTVLLLMLSSLVISTSPASAASCDTRGQDTTTGGYVVTVYCAGAGFIDGFGSTLTSANTNALLLNQIYTLYGDACDGRSTDTTTGGYEVVLWCNGGGFLEAYGTTLSDAAEEARQLILLRVQTGNDCDGRGTDTVRNGYEVTLWCSSGGFVDGVGGTLTGAAVNARLAAG